MTVYLIDGYNVLHQVIGHKQLSVDKSTGQGGGKVGAVGGEPDLEDARKRLLDRIASYMGRTSDRAIVVFDSHAQMLQKQESATANVDVFFGSFSHSADSIIEREVYAISAGENVIVVSSDYQLQKTIFRPNVIRRSSRQFVSDLQEETKSIAISQKCTTMSHRIEDRVEPETVDKLRALRDSLIGKPEERGKEAENREPDPRL